MNIFQINVNDAPDPVDALDIFRETVLVLWSSGTTSESVSKFKHLINIFESFQFLILSNIVKQN